MNMHIPAINNSMRVKLAPMSCTNVTTTIALKVRKMFSQMTSDLRAATANGRCCRTTSICNERNDEAKSHKRQTVVTMVVRGGRAAVIELKYGAIRASTYALLSMSK